MTRGWAVPLVLAGVILLLTTWGNALVWGGSFRVSPTSLTVNARTGTAVFNIANGGDSKVTVQLYAVKWSQDETGRDRMERTREILIFPRQATMEKGASRAIRIGYRGKRLGKQEKTYRLIAEELPISSPGEQVALRLLLRFSVPIFIPPREEISDWNIANVLTSGGNAVVAVINNGNSHLMVNKILITGFDDKGTELFKEEGKGWYVLSKKTKSFAVSLPAEFCPMLREISVSVQVENESRQSKAAVEPDDLNCKKPG